MELKNYHVQNLPVAARQLQSADLDLMVAFTRHHNEVCQKALQNSNEDGHPYCRFNLHVSESGFGQNYYMRCYECGEAQYCGSGVND